MRLNLEERVSYQHNRKLALPHNLNIEVFYTLRLVLVSLTFSLSCKYGGILSGSDTSQHRIIYRLVTFF